MIDNEIAGPSANGWHTVADPANHPGPFELDVDDVQIYSLAISPTSPPSVPTGLIATFVNSGEIDLAWTASTDNVGVAGYNIYRNGVVIGTSTTPAYVDKTVGPGGSYSYAVTAFDTKNISVQSAQSTSATVTIPNFTLGGPVYTLGSSNVMSRAGRGTTVCTQPANVNGTILSGPQFGKGAWWYVGFVSSCSGWVVQTSLGIN